MITRFLTTKSGQLVRVLSAPTSNNTTTTIRRRRSSSPQQQSSSSCSSSSLSLVRHRTSPVLSPFFSQQPPLSSTSLLTAAATTTTRRYFQTESDYHTIADGTLEDIQDAVELALEEKGLNDFEVTYASGVLTLVMPPHGTWVLNKQTPNRQIWWSSPISGPRRYEYNNNNNGDDDNNNNNSGDSEDIGQWVYTRNESDSTTTLIQTLREELFEIYQIELEDYL